MIDQLANIAGAGIDVLMSLIPTPGQLTIIPLKNYGPAPIPAGPPYVAMFNPENWQVQEKTTFDDSQAHGTKGAEQRYRATPPPNLSFDLLIDGTGASGGTKREVLAEIKALEAVIGFNGDLHAPNGLAIIWGSQFFQGKATSFSVKYTLFRPNGTPLRATVSLGFSGDTPRLESILKMALQSADLTRRRIVKSGDRLDNICHQLYNDSRFYLEVARTNNLTSFRKLPVGAELQYPPIEK